MIIPQALGKDSPPVPFNPFFSARNVNAPVRRGKVAYVNPDIFQAEPKLHGEF